MAFSLRQFLTFRYVPVGCPSIEVDAVNHRFEDNMIATGLALVGSRVLKGHTALRMCTINPHTTEEDIRETIQRLERLGNALSLYS
jgi:aromatic-L-amino-acid/L-tryptophan decarboxylase